MSLVEELEKLWNCPLFYCCNNSLIDEREDKSSDAAGGDGDAVGERAPLREVETDDSWARGEGQTVAQTCDRE